MSPRLAVVPAPNLLVTCAPAFEALLPKRAQRAVCRLSLAGLLLTDRCSALGNMRLALHTPSIPSPYARHGSKW
jgi:hypothetical protein